MKEYHKEYSALAMSFLTQFLDDAKGKHPDVKELLQLVQKNHGIKTENGAVEYVTSAYNKLETITNGKDVDGNALLLGVSSCLYLAEEDVFKGSAGMKCLRLANTLYFDLEKNIGTSSEFKTTNNIMDQLDRINRKEYYQG